MKIDDKRLEELADEANIKGDNNLAIILYTLLGSRKVYMDSALATHVQDWAKERAKDIEFFKNRKNN